MQSAVPDKRMKLPAKKTEIHDQELAGLIHEEVIKLYSDTAIVSDEALQDFIAVSKEVLKSSREVSFTEIADFSFARRAASALKEGR